MDINGGRLSFDAYIKDTDFQRQIQAMEQRIIGLSDTSVKEAKRMDETFSKLAKAAAAFLTLNQAQSFVQQLIKVRSEFQQLEIAFTTMLGSKERADQLTQELIEFASTTPFGMSDAANAAKQLLAYGSAAENVTDELRMLGDVAAGTSQPIGDLVYLYGTLRTQGRAYTQDIRQFAGRGIPIYRELANVLGVAEDQVNSLVTAGRVGFAEIEQAFQNMTAAGSMFGGLMEAQSQTIAGELERLGDAIEQMFNEMGQESEGMIGLTIQGLSAIVENYQTILDILTGLIITYGAYRAAVLATTAAQSIAMTTTQGWTLATQLQYRALLLAEGAQKLLNRTMLANPYVAITTAVAGLAFVMYKLANNLSAAESAQKRVNDLIHEANLSVADQTVKLNDLLGVAQDETKSKREREKAIRDINRISPEYLGNLSLETINTKDATTAIDAYIDALRKRAFEEAAYNERVAIERERMNIEANGVGSRLQRAGMWLYEMSGGEKNMMQEAAKRRAHAELDAREKALDEEFKKRSANDTDSDGEQVIVTTSQRLADLNRQIQETEQNLKDALSPDAAYDKSNIDSLKDSLKALRDERDLLMGKSKEGDRANREFEKWGESRLDILRKIAETEEDIRIQSLSSDEREIEQTKRHYAELRRVVEEHNANAPEGAKIGPAVFAKIDTLEAQDTGYLISQQRVEKDLESIGRLRTVAEQITELSDRIAALQGEQASFGLTPAKEAELRQYIELHTELTRSEYDAAFELAKTHNQRLAEIEEAHQQRVNALGDNATDEQIANLQRYRDEAIKQANETEAEKQSIVFKGIQAQMVLTVGALKAQQRAVMDLLDDPSVTGQLRVRLESELEKINTAIQSGAKAATIANFRQRQSELTAELKKLEAAGLANTDVWKEVYDELVHVSRETEEYAQGALQDLLNTILQLVSELDELGSSLSNLGDAFNNNTLRGAGDVLSGIASGIRNISVAFDENASNTDKYAAAIQSLIGMISMVANASAERKRAEEEYYRSVIQLQHDYNMSLVERQRLESQLSEGLYLTDYVGRMQDGMKSGKDAMEGYQEALQKLIDTGQGKDGMRNAVGWSNVGKGVGYGASAGAVIGSVVPVIGTAIGAAVGALVGGIVGLFGGRKKKDTYSSLISQYPELREYLGGDTPQDLAEVRDLAQRLIANQATDAATRQQLEGILDYIDAIEAAREQIRGVVKDLTGEVGDNLRNSLVQAFKAGENAALAMGRTVGQVLEDMLAQLLFAKAFEGVFEGFEEELTNAIALGDDLGVVDAMANLAESIGPAGEQFFEWMDQFRRIASDRGLDIFGGDQQQGSISKGIQGITETTANRLEAEFGGLRLAQLQLLEVSKSQSGQMQQQVNIMNSKLAVLNSINTNTGRTADNTDRLANIETAIVSLNNKVSNTDSLLRGAGLR